MGFSPYSELINKMQKEIENLTAILNGDDYIIIQKQQNEITNLTNKLNKANKNISSLEMHNKELKYKNDALHMSFIALENSKLKNENEKLSRDNCLLQESLNKMINDLETLKHKETRLEPKSIKHTDTKKDKPKNRKKTWGLSPTEHKKLRSEILKRDNYTCQICGNKNNKLHVHHIKERRYGGTNDKYNLISLCSKCHAEQHKNEPVYNLMKKSIT